MRVTLTVTAGPHAGRVFEFTGHDVFLVGRSHQAHFRLPKIDPYFSRVHFVVEVNPPACRLTDMKSRNGTKVNGQRVDVADLVDGDEIKAGHTFIRVAIEGDAPDAYETTITKVVAPSGAPRIPGYELQNVLGRGDIGIVYKARHVATGDTVAIKHIVPGTQATRVAVERFLHDCRTLGELKHPHIVVQREVGECTTGLYVVTEYVPGESADDRVARGVALPPATAVRLMLSVLDALIYAHGQGLVHRDVKPSNVLLTDGGPVKLSDFGLARVFQESQISGLTLTGGIGQTPAYLPPEQITNFRSVDPLADQYSAAATLYRLLAGQPPYDLPPPPAGFLKILESDPVPLADRRPDVPADLAAIVQRALARDPDFRYPDVASFRAALVPFA